MPFGVLDRLSSITNFPLLTVREYSLNNPSKITVSSPDFPSILFFPELPLSLLSRLLPEASISSEPVNIMSSTLLGRVYETDESIKSVPSFKFSLTVSDVESIIYVSSPIPPIKKSLPYPPLRLLFAKFPVIVSLPEPPTAFSIIVPAEIIRFPVRPAMLEVKRLIESFSVDLKSIT